MSKAKKKRHFPVFWFLYVLYVLLLVGALYYALRLLWNFLDVYEQTRPVHAMEAELSVLAPEHEERLRTYLTNTVDNPYEDISAVLDLFYQKIEGQELIWGKLSGSYTESHPTYAVLAGETHVATLSFVMQDTPVDYNLCGWKLEQVSLLITPTHSCALTVPSSMSVFINKKPIEKSALVSETETNTPVSYQAYQVSGLYKEPEIEVFDRYGCPVTLIKDEATGGLYYLLSYAQAPATMNVTFSGRPLDQTAILEDNIAIEELSFLPQLAARFPEYATLPEVISVPFMRKYYIDFAYEPGNVTFTDRFGNRVTPEYDDISRTYSHGLVSDESLREECTERAYSFIEKYALFCANDASSKEFAEYFPPNSEFYKIIASMDNVWYNSHRNLKFQNHQTKEFFAYSENLVYIHANIEQSMILRATGKEYIYPIDLPLWLVKLDGTWYIARIIFDNFTTAQ